MTNPADDVARAIHEAWCGNGERRGKWTAQLLNENDPDGPVVIHCDDGKGGDITMPQDAFWAMREAARDAQLRPMQYTGASVVRLPPNLSHLKPVTRVRYGNT